MYVGGAGATPACAGGLCATIIKIRELEACVVSETACRQRQLCSGGYINTRAVGLLPEGSAVIRYAHEKYWDRQRQILAGSPHPSARLSHVLATRFLYVAQTI